MWRKRQKVIEFVLANLSNMKKIIIKIKKEYHKLYTYSFLQKPNELFYCLTRQNFMYLNVNSHITNPFKPSKQAFFCFSEGWNIFYKVHFIITPALKINLFTDKRIPGFHFWEICADKSSDLKLRDF